MGFSFKKIFSKRGLQSFLGTGGVLPGVDIAITQDAGNKLYEDVHKGLGNLVTGGYIAQKEATEQAKEAADESKKQYAEQQAAVEAETQRLADLDEEKKKRAAAAGTTNPQTLLSGYKGATGTPSLYKSYLGA